MNTPPAESEAQPLGRRGRNKIRIKESLYTAALELFAEQGYDQTSVDEIAERADVARGTFFNHFPHKEDLIGTWGERRSSPRSSRTAAEPANCARTSSPNRWATSSGTYSWALSTAGSARPRTSPRAAWNRN
ncbi:TetR/AcrR family transcriptional regulator [Streptomyces griseofuscus]|uniref:TetR/AcrR family transcriptional regulator n=1 Tax=Streptomyces griseofuscus TaxID=146922 RepID=UPI0036A8C0DF